MNEFTVDELLEQLQLLDECPRIEAKRGSEIGSSVMQTVFSSSVIANEFQATYLLHQLLGEDQLQWLAQFSHLQLTDDEARALILARETGAVDNAGLRAVTGLDTLAASQVLGRLHHQHCLLVKGGAGPATYYQLADWSKDSDELPLFGRQEKANTGDLEANTGDLEENRGDLRGNKGYLPEPLARRIEELTPKTRRDKLWPVIVWLCALQPQKAEQLANLLEGRSDKSLKSSHLNSLRESEKLIAYRFPEVVNHPEQAYQTTEKGVQWLKEQGIDILKAND